MSDDYKEFVDLCLVQEEAAIAEALKDIEEKPDQVEQVLRTFIEDQLMVVEGVLVEKPEIPMGNDEAFYILSAMIENPDVLTGKVTEIYREEGINDISWGETYEDEDPDVVNARGLREFARTGSI